MRRLQLVVLVSAVVAGAIWWAFYRTHHTSSLATASLLPKETLALVHVPDFNHSRAQWHKTDIYQLWKEPAVQEFLAKPRARVPTEGRIGQTVEDLSAAGMKDAFAAVLSVEASAWKWAGGFRCTGDTARGAKLVEDWEARALGSAAAKHETLEYQGRQIQLHSAGLINLATVWAGQWFFFANDTENLKMLIDRADGRVKDANSALSSDDVYLAATKHMPGSYAAVVYSRVDQLIEKLIPAEQKTAASPDQLAMLRQIRSFCAATAFDGGRMRDTVFVGMPKMAETEKLARASLPIATKDTFLYAASVVDLRKEMQPGAQTPGLGWMSGLQQITSTLSAKGISLDEWKTAFGSEVGIVGSWTPNTQWPSLVAALPVKDAARANKIVTTVTTSDPEQALWRHWEKEGVHYFSNSSPGQLFSFSPTLGLSDRVMVIGLDPGAVEAAIKRSATGSSELAAARNFHNADGAVPTAQQSFVYIDPGLLYARFDTALRPLLAMGAAFLPAMSETVDLGKLPPTDVVTKHLSPIVMSQSYRGDGYVAESVGPVPFYQTVVGTGLGTAVLVRQWMPGPGSVLPPAIQPPPLMQPTPSPTPEDSP